MYFMGLFPAFSSFSGLLFPRFVATIARKKGGLPMSESTKKFSGATLYKTPFSRDYWAQAASEFKNLKVLIFAALMIALRVALKSVSIPIAANLRINVAFFINAFGAMVFGPVVAIVAAAISDTLGCLLFPTGVYFFPFIFIEIAGSLIFALFFYRTKVTATVKLGASFREAAPEAGVSATLASPAVLSAELPPLASGFVRLVP